jgi:hypothetical protein
MKMLAFWDIVQCSLIEVERRLKGAYFLHRQSVDDGDSKHLCNVGHCIRDYIAQYPRRLPSFV